MLRIPVYKDRIGEFLDHRDGCVMRQQVDVPTMKLTLEYLTNRRSETMIVKAGGVGRATHGLMRFRASLLLLHF